MKKILLISGSPRKGNTDFVLSNIYDGLNFEKEIIYLKDKKINHCIGCLNCHNNSECVLKDDMNSILKKLLESDIFVIGSPNYFDNISGLLKNFIDRTHPLYKAELLKGKKIITIMVGGGKIKGSQKYINSSMFGFIKYLKLDLIGSYCFQALHINELKNDTNGIAKINNIINFINSL